MASSNNDANRNLAQLHKTDHTNNNQKTTDELTADVVIQKQVDFAEKEKDRRRQNNQNYYKKRKALNIETIAQRKKRVSKETAALLTKEISVPFELMLEKEIRRIMKFDLKDRIEQSKAQFRWVSPLCTDEKLILQFEVTHGIFVDVVYIKKSNFLNAGYGLFAARSLPKGLIFSLYLGRLVKFDDNKRKYTILLSSRFVKKHNGKDRWEKVRKGKAGLIVDALMSDRYSTWTMNRDIFLGAHLMNDPEFQLSSQVKNNNDSMETANSIIQPLLEVVTGRDIEKDEELTLNYNRA